MKAIIEIGKTNRDVKIPYIIDNALNWHDTYHCL